MQLLRWKASRFWFLDTISCYWILLSDHFYKWRFIIKNPNRWRKQCKSTRCAQSFYASLKVQSTLTTLIFYEFFSYLATLEIPAHKTTAS